MARLALLRRDEDRAVERSRITRRWAHRSGRLAAAEYYQCYSESNKQAAHLRNEEVVILRVHQTNETESRLVSLACALDKLS